MVPKCQRVSLSVGMCTVLWHTDSWHLNVKTPQTVTVIYRFNWNISQIFKKCNLPETDVTSGSQTFTQAELGKLPWHNIKVQVSSMFFSWIWRQQRRLHQYGSYLWHLLIVGSWFDSPVILTHVKSFIVLECKWLTETQCKVLWELIGRNALNRFRTFSIYSIISCVWNIRVWLPACLVGCYTVCLDTPHASQTASPSLQILSHHPCQTILSTLPLWDTHTQFRDHAACCNLLD